MKKSELVKIIKNAVREELNESLPNIVTRLITESTNKTQDPLEITKQVLKSAEKPKSKLKQYSKNEALNRVLNETVGGVPAEGSRATNGYEEPPMTDLNGQIVDAEQLPDHVTSALTRDYSKLLNKVEEKKNQKLGIR